MDVSNPRNRIGGSRASELFSSRRGALIIAIAAALAAGVLFYVFAQNYKSSAPTVVPPENVVVAEKFIPAGAAGSVIASEGLLKTVPVPGAQVVAGAITSLSAIAGEVSSSSIAAGQQLTVADFSHANAGVGAYLSGDQRAITVSLDPAHGSTTLVAQGDSVDVMLTYNNTTKLLAQNVTVLGNAAGEVTLRVTDRQALTIANAADTAKLWLTLRPPVQAQQSIPVGATATTP